MFTNTLLSYRKPRRYVPPKNDALLCLTSCYQTNIVLHIDPLRPADPLPLGMDCLPYVVVRVQPMAGEISRYSVTSVDPNGDPEEEIVHTARIPGRVVQTSKHTSSLGFPSA